MASYSNSSYSNSFYDLTGVYFNSTSQTSSNIDIDESDTRYLQKSGGTISNNLLVNGSVEYIIQTALNGKQPTIETDDLAITDTAGLATALAGSNQRLKTAT